MTNCEFQEAQGKLSVGRGGREVRRNDVESCVGIRAQGSQMVWETWASCHDCHEWRDKRCNKTQTDGPKAGSVVWGAWEERGGPCISLIPAFRGPEAVEVPFLL